jgi:hypothetical protein
MAETKRVSDQYTISAPTVIIDGNLTVSGSTTSVETTNSTIADNIVVLNQGETGAGITAVTSGIEIERGSLTNVSIVYDDSVDAFKVLLGAGLTNIRVAEPIDSTDAATKNYVDTITSGSLTVGGVDTSVQFNSGGSSLGGDTNFTYDGFNLNIGDTTINSGSIGTNSTNSDLEIYANGSGTIYTRSVIKMENETSDPSSVSGANQIYAKTPDGGGTGVYFVNSTASGEMVSKAKAIVFGIIF